MQMDGSRAPASFGILDTLLEVEASRNFVQALREGPQYYNELPGTDRQERERLYK